MESNLKRVTAVLGPTNTGKTHLAMETMLEYESGVIGFPLRLLAREIFDKSDKFTKSIFIKHFKIRLSRALVNLIYTIDPDAIVFGGGLSNEIKSLNEIKNMVIKNMEIKNLNTKFLKARYGDASGVRGAARLGRKINY